MPEERILVGQFGAAHGIKGEVRLKSFTQDPQAILRYGPLFDASGKRRFEILGIRPVKDDLLIARLKDITTRNEAEALAGVQVYVMRAGLPPPQEDEFYFADLIGLAAYGASGEIIGQVRNVLNYGAGDMLEIAPGAAGETLLIPFTKEAVPVVDVTGGRLVVVPPAEIELPPEPDEDAELTPEVGRDHTA